MASWRALALSTLVTLAGGCAVAPTDGETGETEGFLNQLTETHLAVVQFRNAPRCAGDPSRLSSASLAECLGLDPKKLPVKPRFTRDPRRLQPNRPFESVLGVQAKNGALFGVVAVGSMSGPSVVALGTEGLTGTIALESTPVGWVLTAAVVLVAAGTYLFNHRERVQALLTQVSSSIREALTTGATATSTPAQIGGVNIASCKDPSTGDWLPPFRNCPAANRCDRDWETLRYDGASVRPPEWAPCAPPPPGGCTQVVLGRQVDLKRFLDCPGYEVLHLTPADWSLQANRDFVGCALAGRLGTCRNNVLLATHDVPDYYEGEPFSGGRDDYSQASEEMCQLARCGPDRVDNP